MGALHGNGRGRSPSRERLLPKLQDWELLKALHQHERGWDGLITSDDSMLNLEKEMSVLTQTKLTLVVANGQGHNPIRATGVLLAHIDNICHQTLRTKAQIWNLNVSQKPAYQPWDELTKIAKRKGTTAKALFDACRISELGG